MHPPPPPKGIPLKSKIDSFDHQFLVPINSIIEISSWKIQCFFFLSSRRSATSSSNNVATYLGRSTTYKQSTRIDYHYGNRPAALHAKHIHVCSNPH